MLPSELYFEIGKLLGHVFMAHDSRVAQRGHLLGADAYSSLNELVTCCDVGNDKQTQLVFWTSNCDFGGCARKSTDENQFLNSPHSGGQHGSSYLGPTCEPTPPVNHRLMQQISAQTFKPRILWATIRCFSFWAIHLGLSRIACERRELLQRISLDSLEFCTLFPTAPSKSFLYWRSPRQTGCRISLRVPIFIECRPLVGMARRPLRGRRASLLGCAWWLAATRAAWPPAGTAQPWGWFASCIRTISSSTFSLPRRVPTTRCGVPSVRL